MTRRMMPQQPKFDDCRFEWGIDNKGKANVAMYRGETWLCDIYPSYQVGEEVAVAQCYKNIDHRGIVDYEDASDIQPGMVRPIYAQESAGWKNKLFVKAEYMPYSIKITDIKVERLTDITEEDCRKEGIICVNFRQWLKQDLDDFSPQEYVDHDVWTLPIFRDALENGWGEQSKDDIASYTAKTAFIVLFAKLSHKSPSEVNALNPWLFAYEFKLIKD